MHNRAEKFFRAVRLVLFVVWLPLLTGLLAGCDADDPYRRGFDAGQRNGERTGRAAGYEDGHAAGLAEGEKSGKDSGYALGLCVGTVKGYGDGTATIVGENWQPSLALGICATLVFLTVYALGKILLPPVRALAEVVVSVGRSGVQRLLATWLGRRIERRQAVLAAEHWAVRQEQAKLAVVETLRAMGTHLTEERMRTAVEGFLTQSVIMQEFSEELELSIQVIAEARASILKNPDLSPAAQASLLQRLSAQLRRSAPPAT